ncbi:Aste57867_24079 [Aphanomyces stellatus]|uniref:Aste57867_24079 protein n=1 Tax=Aphanomyces stellatus TaxID=120398 RepID=A0A485LPC5_9STRA|nr:hypothetical protein As57867_024006 [Aphanomyces stellatus]VFU00721.1 Aste57867_24079 [Aphanomyces stellatus]
MAPEVLAFRHYTIAVDVFSFGVLLSELDTHQIPYSDKQSGHGNRVSDAAIVSEVLRSGLRPTFSSSCPQWLMNLASECMAGEASQRPEPVDIVSSLSNHLALLRNEGKFPGCT